MLLMCWVIQCFLIMLSVAFFTLFERKVMGLFHLRVGPNKPSFLGLLQPLIDAFKLLSKQWSIPAKSNSFTYMSSPVMALALSLFLWVSIPMNFMLFSMPYSLMLFFVIGSSLVFPTLLAGWASNSKYSLMGSLRSIAQSISYEAVLSTLIVFLAFLHNSFSIKMINDLHYSLVMLLLPIGILCALAEAHRAPFDFSESESELVSGFNTEYGGVNFAFFFLAEYSVLLCSCFFVWLIYLSSLSFNLGMWLSGVGTIALAFGSIWIRVSFCRFRYDLLMNFSWKCLLPLVLSMFLMSIILYV